MEHAFKLSARAIQVVRLYRFLLSMCFGVYAKAKLLAMILGMLGHLNGPLPLLRRRGILLKHLKH